MITVPRLKDYPLIEFIPYSKNFVKVCNDNTPIPLQINLFVDGLQTSLQPVEDAFSLQKDSPQTQELETHDMDRDDYLVCIRTVAIGFLKSKDPAKRAAAQLIIDTIDNYGSSIQNFNLIAETEAIDKITKEFETDAKLIAALALLGLADTAADLKAANIAFNDKFIERNKLLASKPSQPAHKLKPAAIDAYKRLVKQIEALATIDTTGKYNVLISQLNELTDKYNINASRGKGGANTPTPTQPQP